MRKVPVLTLVLAVLVAAPGFAQDITNAIGVGDNNRIVGVDGGNIFQNGLTSGGMIESVVNLGLPSGGNGTPNGVSPAATLVSLADVDRNVMAQGENTAEAGGLTANLMADGSYTVSADDTFAAPMLVSFGASGGGTSLLAAPGTAITLDSNSVSLFPATGIEVAEDVELNGDTAVITAGPGQGRLVIATAPVEVNSPATVSFDYNASGPANIAAIGFDSGFPPVGEAVNYTQLVGDNVAVDETKNIAVSLFSFTGNVLAAFQVVNQGDADVTVTISNLMVIESGDVTDYVVDPSSTVDVAALADWNLAGINNPAGEATVVDGNLSLSAADGEQANALTSPTAPAGAVQLNASVQVGEGAPASAFFALVWTDGINTINSFVPAANLASDAFSEVTVGGTTSTGLPSEGAPGSFLVVQMANGDATVESVSIDFAGPDDSAWDDSLFN